MLIAYYNDSPQWTKPHALPPFSSLPAVASGFLIPSSVAELYGCKFLSMEVSRLLTGHGRLCVSAVAFRI
eukprot:3684909-Amphidinium_carterae.1